MNNITGNWFDVVVLLVLGFGCYLGRKRGMSNELLPLFQWLVMVVVAAEYYGMLAELLRRVMPIGQMWTSVFAYLLIVIGIKTVFTFVKRLVGEKLVSSDLFGRAEYYLGMVAGGLRHACWIIFFLALLHARAFTVQQVEFELKEQEKLYGSRFFPTYGQIQMDVFYRSFVGTRAGQHIEKQLIAPMAPAPKVDRKLATDREKAVDDVMNPKPKEKKKQ